jgi:hypothetical protein
MAYFARKLTGRCGDGFERGKGNVSHAVATDTLPCRDKALCGAAPGRLSNGWAQPDQVERVTCVRCSARLQGGGHHGRRAREQSTLTRDTLETAEGACVDAFDGSYCGAARSSRKVRWCWYGDEDGGQVWTAAHGDFYLEVNRTTGRCEIAEWDDESADIGRSLWEAHHPDESVDTLQRIVENALAALRGDDSVASSTPLDAMSSELLALLQRAGRLTIRDALRSAERHELHESAALIVLAGIAREPGYRVVRYYVDRSSATARLLDEAELRDVIEQRFVRGTGGCSRAASIEVVWATSVSAAIAGNNAAEATEREATEHIQ